MLEKLCEEVGVELYDTEISTENNKKIYRIYIVKPLKNNKREKISLEDCARLSEILSPIFDVEPPVSGEYFLEVSSTGLERNLSKKEHFDKSTNELVKIQLLDNTKLQGLILKVVDNTLVLQTDKEELQLELSGIKKARTFVKW